MQMVSKIVRCGIIGCGVIGPVHAEALQKLENVEIKWACDLVIEKANKLSQQFQVSKITTDYREVLQDPEVDAVFVCTDHASHASITIDALAHGKHVLCEKVLAAHPSQLQAMLEAHQRYPNLIFGGVFQHRFEPLNQYLRHLLSRQVLGTLLTANVRVLCLRTAEYYQSDAWRGTWEFEGGGVCINQAIHFIDLLVWMLNGVEKVCGSWTNRTHQGVIEVEDTAVASLKFCNGTLGVLQATSSVKVAHWDCFLGFYGSDGLIEIHGNKPHRIQFHDPEIQKEVEDKMQNLNESFSGLNTAKFYYGPGHKAQVADFIEAIRIQRDPFVTAHSAAHTAAVVHALYESARLGRWVRPQIPFLEN